MSPGALLAGLSLVALAVWGCEGGTGVGQGTARLLIDPPRLELGRVFVGQVVTTTTALIASGDLPVQFSARLEGGLGGLVVGPAGGQIRAGGTQRIDVTYAPDQGGSLDALVRFTTDAKETPSLELRIVATAIEPPSCEDGNGCTEDSFDLAEGRCVHRAAPLPCSDFNACSSNDVCVEGVCVGVSTPCDDDNPCTDDLCDPATGCVHVPTRACDDGNPCTADRCLAGSGCASESLADGTPCDDGEVCTTADICLFGSCRGVSVPEGALCDDGDPCSKLDRCIQGRCLDPTYSYPGPGDLAFTSTVGALAPDAAENPIIDGRSATYVGTSTGVTAVDECGDRLWARTTTITPRWSAALAFPGVILAPVDDALWVLTALDGQVLRRVPLEPAFGARTSSTSTVSLVVVDAAMRGSGIVVASLIRREQDRAGERRASILAEVDWRAGIATKFRDLGDAFARRVVIDRDESIVAILEGPSFSQLTRFGIEDQLGGSWSTRSTTTAPSELAIAGDGRVLWTEGLIAVSAMGGREVLLADDRTTSGAPIVTSRGVALVARPRRAPEPGGDLVAIRLTASSTAPRVLWQVSLGGRPAAGLSPTRDGLGTSFIATREPALLAFSSAGAPLFETLLPVPVSDTDRLSVSVTPKGRVIVLGRRHVIGVQGQAGLEGSPWPRHRRDNLSSGHR